jgi:hypothetical protein
MWEVMYDCVIMHNIVIKSDRKTQANGYVGLYECQSLLTDIDHQVPVDFVDFMGMHVEIRDSNTHQQLQDDLIEYLWRLSHQIC